MKKLIIIALATVAISGCNDFLDKMPDNRTKIDSPEKVAALLVSAYPDRTFASIIDARCDGFADYGSLSTGSQPSSSFQYTAGAFLWEPYSPTESGNDSHEKYWSSCYRAIAASNQAIASIDEMGNTKDLNIYMAEARLSRAYSHLCLLTLYANFFDEANRGTNPGIPFVDIPEDVIIKQYERGTVASTLALIKADVEFGLKYVGVTGDYTQPKFHFTKPAAIAMALRIALFERDYNAVITYANMLLPNASVLTPLVDGNGNPIMNSDGTKLEIVHPSDGAYLYMQANLHNWAVYSKLAGSGPIGMEFTSPKQPANLLVAEVVTGHNRTCRGNVYSRYAHSESFASSLLGANATGGSWIYPAYSFSGESLGWCPKFYEDFKQDEMDPTTGIAHIKIALFRLEEVLLSRAEAYAMTGKYQEALNDLNMYTQKRIASYNVAQHYLAKDDIIGYYSEVIGAPSHYINSKFNANRFTSPVSEFTGQLHRALIMTILDFRRTEFAYEGMRYFDILRWNIPVTHKRIDGRESTLTPDDDRRVIQIPQSASISGVEANRYDHIPMPW